MKEYILLAVTDFNLPILHYQFDNDGVQCSRIHDTRDWSTLTWKLCLQNQIIVYTLSLVCCCRYFQTFAGSLPSHSWQSDHWRGLSWCSVPIRTWLFSLVCLHPCPPAAGHNQLQDQRQTCASLKLQTHICGRIFFLNMKLNWDWFIFILWCYWQRLK